jgi:uncharacterized protein YndB with AHSA1/START domain
VTTTEPIELEFSVPCAPARAFELWTARISTWWPSTHTVSAAPGLVVTVEAGVGGRIYERTPAGAEHDWGEVLVWDPPGRFGYRWHLRQDPADATEVLVTFSPGREPGSTTVAVSHTGWERLGPRGPELRGRNTAGWGGLLPHYQRAAASG